MADTGTDDITLASSPAMGFALETLSSNPRLIEPSITLSNTLSPLRPYRVSTPAVSWMRSSSTKIGHLPSSQVLVFVPPSLVHSQPKHQPPHYAANLAITCGSLPVSQTSSQEVPLFTFGTDPVFSQQQRLPLSLPHHESRAVFHPTLALPNAAEAVKTRHRNLARLQDQTTLTPAMLNTIPTTNSSLLQPDGSRAIRGRATGSAPTICGTTMQSSPSKTTQGNVKPLSMHPKAVESRVRRAKRAAQDNKSLQPSQDEAVTPPRVLCLEKRQGQKDAAQSNQPTVAQRFDRLYTNAQSAVRNSGVDPDPRAASKKVSPAKRLADGVVDASLASKRQRSASHPATLPSPQTPSDTEHALPAESIRAKSLAKVGRNSMPEEKVGQTISNNDVQHEKPQLATDDRQIRDIQDRRRLQSSVNFDDAESNNEQTTLHNDTLYSTGTDPVTGGAVERACLHGRVPASQRLTAATHTTSASGAEQGMCANGFTKAQRGKITDESHLNIQLYSAPGEDLDWTKVRDKARRQKMQRVIARRKARAKKQEADMANFTKSIEVSMDSDVTDEVASDAKPHKPVGDAQSNGPSEAPVVPDAEMPRHDESNSEGNVQGAKNSVLDLRTTSNCDDVPEHTLPYEDLILKKHPTSSAERKRMQNINWSRERSELKAQQRIRAIEELKNTPPVPGFDAVVLHPTMGIPIPLEKLEDIRRFSTVDGNLDWTKCTNKVERNRRQSEIYSLKMRERRKLAKRAADTLAKASAPRGTLPKGEAYLVDQHPERARRAPNSHASRHATDSSILQGNHDEEDNAILTQPSREQSAEAQISLREGDDPHLQRRGRIGAPCPTANSGKEVEKYFVNGIFTDIDFVEGCKFLWKAKLSMGGSTFYMRHLTRMLELVETATAPQANEILIDTSGQEAAKYLEPTMYFSGPIVTFNQQWVPLQTLDDYFREFFDDNIKVHAQDPNMAVATNELHIRLVTIREVKKRFAEPVKGAPWNLLELAHHFDDGLRPAFLNGMDSRLLTKLKLPSTADVAQRWGYEKGWKEVEKWALVAQAGALTEPHQDSHGYSTYITVNQGTVGFGWLSDPTDEERAAWAEKHQSYIGGRWRYVILRKGMTIYFPAATIHFVFRHPHAGNTLAFGGHVLRCSQIVRWVKTLNAEVDGPEITNEDISVSAPGYLDRVEKYVKQALKTGQEEVWGGKEAIDEFLYLKGVFTRKHAEREKMAKGRRG